FETKNKRLLAVLAHPDDESFGPGGTLAFYGHHDVDVHLICATRGEAGEIPPDFDLQFEDIGQMREHELRCAASHLNLSELIFLDYRDSGMPGTEANQHPRALVQAPMEDLVATVTHHIRRIRPQVVITFDPFGGYGHPDHIAMHVATLKAFEACADPAFPDDLEPYQPQKLYYHTFPRRQMRWLVRLMELFGRDPTAFGQNNDIDLKEIVEHDYPIHARIDYTSVAEQRDLAVACHASQDGGGSTGLIGWLSRLLRRRDTFMRAYPPANGNLHEKDLFVGLREEKTVS
ncbi:MAG: PIG-L family deacetylase, partial [Anaerolineales bacterium]